MSTAVTLAPDPASIAVRAGSPSAVLRMALDTGCRDHAAADALVDRVAAWVRAATAGRVPGPALASTHQVTGPRPRVAVVLTWSAGPDLDTMLAADLLTHAGGEPAGAAVVVQTKTVRLTSSGDGPGAARAALSEHEQRRAGRLVRFPGQERLLDPMSVADVEATTIVDRVVGLAGCEVAPGSVLHLDGWARPTWTGRGCELLVRRGARGLVPYEVSHQQAGCTDH